MQMDVQVQLRAGFESIAAIIMLCEMMQQKEECINEELQGWLEKKNEVVFEPRCSSSPFWFLPLSL